MSASSGFETRFPDWLETALCTEPADRPAAEQAITELYALVEADPPKFVWASSPRAAIPLVSETESLAGVGLMRVEHRLAELARETRKPLPTASFGLADTIRAALPPRRGGLHWYGQQEAPQLAAAARARTGEFPGTLGPWIAVARSCGWWWPREGRCVVADRPSVVHVERLSDGGARAHSATGPVFVFRDGFSGYAWYGTPVPSWVIEEPTAQRIYAERNIEIRRCAIERVGWTSFLEEAGHEFLAEATDPGNPGRSLRLYDLPHWEPPSRLLLAVNGSVERDGTRRRYGLRVPPWLDDPVAAAAWSYGLSGDQYANLLRRT